LPGPGRRLVAGTLLRRGVAPFLFVLDLATLGLAALALGGVRGSTLVLGLVVVLLYVNGGLYRSRLTLSALDDLPALVGRALAAGAVSISVALVLGAELVRPRLLAVAALFAGGVVLERSFAYAVVRAARRRRRVAHPTLVLGGGRIGGMLMTNLLAHPEYGLDPVGFLDDDPLLRPDERPAPHLGGFDALASAIVEFGVQEVIVAFAALSEDAMVDVLRTCDRLSCEIFVVPRLFEMGSAGRDTDVIWGLPVVRVRRAPFRTFSWRIKRVLDIVCAAAAIVVLSPLLALVALAVRLEGGRGVLFRQERVGLDGRPFQVLKFRSLRPVDDTESATLWNIKHDDRLGPVGKFIRKTSIDELPQLFNILRGDMSVVGPRPERPFFVAEFSRSLPRYMARHRVPAGLTGWSQVHGLRGDTSIEERARFDNFYVEHWSLWLDLKVVLRTVGSVIRGSGG
jgi:exopolysaccharide biosynthesis polyprenyl glycosylphosphotransferase